MLDNNYKKKISQNNRKKKVCVFAVYVQIQQIMFHITIERTLNVY